MIPISQNLQLASQSNVTPWELPYEELFAGLANKQKTFDDTTSALSKIPEMVPKGGVHTQVERQKLMDELNEQLSLASNTLNETGKLNPSIINNIKTKLTSDPRLQLLEIDEKYITPNSLKNKYEGVLDNAAHNITNKEGGWTQVGDLDELGSLGFIKNEDYVGYLTNQIKGIVTNEASSIKETINSNFKTKKTKDGTVIGDVVDIQYSPATGAPYLVVTKDEYAEEINALTKGYLEERLLTPFDESGISLAEAWYNNETGPINFFKRKEEFEGRGSSFNDFLARGLSPVMQGLQFFNESVQIGKSKIGTPMETSDGTSGESGTTPQSPDINLEGAETLYGIDIYQQIKDDYKTYFDFDVEKTPTTEALHKSVMKSEQVVADRISNNSRIAESSTQQIKEDIPLLSELEEFETFLQVDDSGFIDTNLGSNLPNKLIDLGLANENNVEEVIESLSKDVAKWLNVNGESLENANSETAIIKATQENLISMRENLYTFAGVDFNKIEEEENKFLNAVPSNTEVLKVSENKKARSLSQLLQTNKISANELKEGNYVLSPIGKLVDIVNNPEEAQEFLETNARNRYALSSENKEGEGYYSYFSWDKLPEEEKDVFRQEVLENGKKRLEDYTRAYELEVSKAVVKDLTPKQKEAIEASLKMQSQLQLSRGTVFYMDEFTRQYKSSDITTRDKHQEAIEKGFRNILKNTTDLSEVKFRFENETILNDETTKNHLNALINGATFESKTTTDGDTKTQLTYKVGNKTYTSDLGFRFDLGEFNEDGSPKIMVDVHLSGLPVEKTRKKQASEKYGVNNDAALQVVEIPLDNKSDLGRYIHLAMYNSDENYRKVYDNKRYHQINKDLKQTGQTQLSLFTDDSKPENDIDIRWQHVAGKGQNETEYKGRFSLGGIDQTDFILTAKSPLQIREIESTLNSIATRPEIVTELSRNPNGPFKLELINELSQDFYSKPASSLNDVEHQTLHTIVNTLVNNFPSVTLNTGEEFLYIPEEEQVQLSTINNQLQEDVLSSVIIQGAVSNPIIRAEVMNDYVNLINSSVGLLKKHVLEDYKVSIEGAWRSLNEQKDLINKDKTGVEKTGAVSNSGHLSARSIDLTFKKDDGTKLSKEETKKLEQELKNLGFDARLHGEKYHIHVNLKSN